MNLIKPKTASILVVDETPENLDVLVDHLKNANLNISVALSGEKAIEITQKMIPDIILLDIKMPGIDGFETCHLLKQNTALQDVPVIFITAATETVDKVKGFAVGGVDYITKPFEHEEALARINTHLTLRHQQQQLAQKNAELTQLNKQLKQEIVRREQAEEALSTVSDKLSTISQEEAERWGLSAFVGKSQAMKKVITDIRPLQKVDKTSVLILGESGTGKELIARAIHFGGIRAKGSFIPVNCSAIPEQLAESSFFGHVKGAFTGALNSRKGYFEQAQSGSLFLDEIGDMPLPLQAKLLRTLEDGLVTPIGGEQSKQLDVRIIAATNADLLAKVTAGLFRQDLYFRLASYTVTVPPLRERKEDIALLVKHFLSVFAKEMGHKITTLTPQAQARLENYHFPGNIRELKNIIEHALIKSGSTPIQTHHLHFVYFRNGTSIESSVVQIVQREENDEDKILTYVCKHGSINNSQCRQLLNSNLSRTSYLLRKMYQKGLLVREGKLRWAVYRLP
ncbi:MAG: sigma-54-dependent Fis family transcriptional regulator [Candidatus Parabeggiatoa sp. nov. 1]|nr:MAG: sigma-54-dependent Fis family transcriptional regulator [Gammaproteobacteria bacterium]